MDKQYAIFDFDGTLVDSMGYWQRTEQAFLAGRGVTEDTRWILERVKPMTVPEAAKLFIREFGLSGSPEEMSEEMYAEMARRYREEIPLKEGAADYLAALAGRGVRMCVASATENSLMRETLRRLGVENFFAFTISCIDVGAGKFEPDIYLAAARRLGAPPEEIAVYEDAPYALQTAKKAGFYTVGVYDQYAAAHWEEIRRIADTYLERWDSPV